MRKKRVIDPSWRARPDTTKAAMERTSRMIERLQVYRDDPDCQWLLGMERATLERLGDVRRVRR